MKHEDLTHEIIGCAYRVFNQLGFGFLEGIYQKALIIELTKIYITVESEKPLKVSYDDQVIGDFKIDLFVDNSVIVELKSVQTIAKEHEVQTGKLSKWIKERCWSSDQFRSIRSPSQTQIP